MTQAAALQQEPSYLGNVYCAASGQWAFRLLCDGEDLVRGAGFEDEVEAAEACADQFPDVDFPIRLIADPDFDLSLVDDCLSARIDQTNQIISSLHDYWILNPHDSLDADGVLELLSDLYLALNGEVAE